MPAVSEAQRKAAAIAKHHPEKLFKRNRRLLKMSSDELHKFASTKESGLPKKKPSIVTGNPNKKKRRNLLQR